MICASGICEFLLYLESTPYTAITGAELVLKRLELHEIWENQFVLFPEKERLGAICLCRCFCCARVAKDLLLYQWGWELSQQVTCKMKSPELCWDVCPSGRLLGQVLLYRAQALSFALVQSCFPRRKGQVWGSWFVLLSATAVGL